MINYLFLFPKLYMFLKDFLFIFFIIIYIVLKGISYDSHEHFLNKHTFEILR